jgi:hypothetical protein
MRAPQDNDPRSRHVEVRGAAEPRNKKGLEPRAARKMRPNSYVATRRIPPRCNSSSKHIRFNHHGSLCKEDRRTESQVLYVSLPSENLRADARKLRPYLYVLAVSLRLHLQRPRFIAEEHIKNKNKEYKHKIMGIYDILSKIHAPLEAV